MLTNSGTRWVIEMDFGADPEISQDKVRQALATELTIATKPEVDGSTLVLCSADAFRVRMQFFDHIRSIERM